MSKGLPSPTPPDDHRPLELNSPNGKACSATLETTVWFNRVLNIIHANAPNTKIILVLGPEDVVPAIEREIGKDRFPE
jgi:hypothetical protein